jgi:hypothetical protein
MQNARLANTVIDAGQALAGGPTSSRTMSTMDNMVPDIAAIS